MPDHVVIRCPACGASEAADPAVLADAPLIVCRNCGETWPTAPRRTKRRAAPVAIGPEGDSRSLDAQRRPLVTYSGGVEKAWAAKVEGDVLPLPPRQAPRILTVGAGLASLLFIGAFLAGREAAVAALPDLAGLYRTIGIAVNLDGLAIRDVRAERLTGGQWVRISVRGTIVNMSGSERTVPPLVLAVRGGDAETHTGRGFDPPTAKLAAGESALFALELDDVPANASEITLRFRRAAEPIAAASRNPA